MAEITVKAIDSAAAMEEIVKRLGVDALIVSTRKVDGQIEIVATNDEPIVVERKSLAEANDNSKRPTSFADVLSSKVVKTKKVSDDTIIDQDTTNLEKTGFEIIKNMREELRALSQLIDGNEAKKQPVNTDYYALKASGLRKSSETVIPNFDLDASLTENSKAIAKAFVRGHSKNFEDSDIFFVVGLEKSGKSAFIDKFKLFCSEKLDFGKVHTFFNVTGASDYNNVATWFEKNNKRDVQPPKRCVVEVNDINQFETQLYRFQKINPSIQYSVINVVEAGRSYEYLVNNIRRSTLENEYLVISKLDTCDITVSEISAILDLGYKCSFFSGLVENNEGLYYARVDQVASHIVALAEKHKEG
jgi:hypothetical protein